MHIITSNSKWTLSELLLRTIHIKVQLKYSYFSLITWSTTGVVGRQQRAVQESPAAYRKPFKVLSKLEVSFVNTDIGYLINQAHNGNVTFSFFHLNFFLHAFQVSQSAWKQTVSSVVGGLQWCRLWLLQVISLQCAIATATYFALFVANHHW